MISEAVDETDSKIIGELRRNGRATYSELGRKVGLSPHAVADRVRRLTDRGHIAGFEALIDFAALGRALDALVDVRLLPATSPDEFEQRVAKLPTVRELLFVTGRFDYLLRLACRDADDLDKTVRVLRQEAGAAVTETRVVLRSSRHEPEIHDLAR